MYETRLTHGVSTVKTRVIYFRLNCVIIDYMKKLPLRRPEDMTQEEPRESVSARVRKSTKRALQDSAKQHGLSLGTLIGNVLDDYVKLLEEEKN